MRFTLKNPRSLQYIDYQNVRKTEFLGCQSQEEKASFEEWLGLEKGERFDPDEFDPSIANEDIEDLVKLIEEGKDDF